MNKAGNQSILSPGNAIQPQKVHWFFFIAEVNRIRAQSEATVENVVVEAARAHLCVECFQAYSYEICV
jgi:hypothetical protein